MGIGKRSFDALISECIRKLEGVKFCWLAGALEDAALADGREELASLLELIEQLKDEAKVELQQ